MTNQEYEKASILAAQAGEGMAAVCEHRGRVVMPGLYLADGHPYNAEGHDFCADCGEYIDLSGKVMPRFTNAAEITSLRATVAQLKKQNKNLRKSHDKIAGKYGTAVDDFKKLANKKFDSKVKYLTVGYLFGMVITAFSAAFIIKW